MKILYVEDNAVNLSLIQRIAQMHKHELVSYEEAEVALQKLEEGLQVDIILLDIQLAGEMDGIDFAKAVRARGWQQPIIAITAYAMMGDKERILAAGCNDYLPKPLPIAEFLTLLARYDPNINSTPPTEEAATSSPIPPDTTDNDEGPKTQPLPPKGLREKAAASPPTPQTPDPQAKQAHDSIWGAVANAPASDTDASAASDTDASAASDTPEASKSEAIPQPDDKDKEDTVPFQPERSDQDTVPITTTYDEKTAGDDS